MSESVYALNVGRDGFDRLALVQRIYGPTSREWLLRAGLRPGMRALELACGTGAMTRVIAELIGPDGSLVAVDNSDDQLETARAACGGLGSIEFIRADAGATGLEEASFDLVYFRLLAMHHPDPLRLLKHVRNLLKPGGALVCEEAAIDSTFTDPPYAEQLILHEMATALGSERGCDFNIARRLGSLIQEAGFGELEVGAHIPVYTRGEEKFLEVASFGEALNHWKTAPPEVINEGREICEVLSRAAANDAVVYGLSTMRQFIARRTGSL